MSFVTLLESRKHDSEVKQPDPTQVQTELGELFGTQEKLHKEMLEQVIKNLGEMRASASKSTPPNFEGGDDVMVTRDRELGALPKLITTWTAP